MSPQAGPLDVLVIGGGQAGLAMGYHLARRERRFEIVDAGAEIGQVWRSRWDSLRLFTSARYDNLPGLPFPASPDTYPGKDAVADYLRAYATHFQLPVRLNTTVTSLSGGAGGYVAASGATSWQAREVVVATGPFQVPFVPPVAARLGPEVVQLHSADYRNPAALLAGRVLVVGAANSGCQIAEELSATHRVELSVGRRLPALPQRPLGRDVWAWASAVGLDRVSVSSRLGRRLASRDVLIGGGPRQLARRHGVRIRPRVTTASGQMVTFADGGTGEFDAVVWATGYTSDHSWINVPDVKDERGGIRHTRGVTPVPGLYLLGLTWQHTRGSALLGWVQDDAAFLAEQIASSGADVDRCTRAQPAPAIAAGAGGPRSAPRSTGLSPWSWSWRSRRESTSIASRRTTRTPPGGRRASVSDGRGPLPVCRQRPSNSAIRRARWRRSTALVASVSASR